MANTWQGQFPWQNLQSDGYEGTSPILAIIPYCLVRGTFSRIARLWVRRDAA